MNREKYISEILERLDKPITLIGLMGAGKSSVGRALGKALNLEFVDSDIVIEGKQRRTIAEIFDKAGEPFFRELEREAIISLASEPEIKIIGTGGGAFMNAQTREVIQGKTLSVFLHADVNILAKRVGNGAGRPLFAGKEPRDVLNDLVATRYPIYKDAHLTIETQDEPPYQTLDRVLEALYNHMTLS